MNEAHGGFSTTTNRNNNNQVDGNDNDDASSTSKKKDVASMYTPPRPQIPAIWAKFLHRLERIEALEKRVNAHASRSRRRIQSVLDQVPSHRKSHLRLFVTHRHDRMTGVWTLCIEGRLLVGNKDHDNAASVDSMGVLSVREQRDEAKEGTGGSGGEEVAKASTTDASTAASASLPAISDRTSDRNQYKMGEREEDPIEPLIFTHFFDKLEVDFRTVYLPKVPPAEAPSPSSSVKKSRSTKRKAVQVGPPAFVNPNDLRASPPTKLVWTKDASATDDSCAFFVKYNNHFSERPPPPNMRFHSISADIRLFPTRPESTLTDTDADAEPVYRVSTSLSRRFFPRHSNEGGTVRQSRSSPISSPATKKKKLDPDSMDDDSSGGDQGAENDDENDVRVENEIHVPALLTYNEIVMAMFQYVQDNKLYDPADKSLVVCDEVLTDVLQTESFNFSQLQNILIGKNLITRVEVDEEPVVLTYVMNEKTTSPQTPTGYSEVGDHALSTRNAFLVPEDPDHHPTVLSFDMDVAFPSLFSYRSREFLRRVKKREFEYTSSRTKARYLLVASKGSEEVIKTKIEQCISGQGYVEENIPVFLALAKAAAANSEAQIAAQIDSRTCDLVSRLDENSRQAATAWDAVDALHQVMDLETMACNEEC